MDDTNSIDDVMCHTLASLWPPTTVIAPAIIPVVLQDRYCVRTTASRSRKTHNICRAQFLTDTAICDRVEILISATGLLTGAGAAGRQINMVRKTHCDPPISMWAQVHGTTTVPRSIAGHNSKVAMCSRAVRPSDSTRSWTTTSATARPAHGILWSDLAPTTCWTPPTIRTITLQAR
jgi:hypothetical protein